ncbi:hypothetical protein [Candidatus Ichthyocystis hellenicum]|uniref:hypothetical protein n=1 Tax=Candidatus Ichthyocystis hellenicum TaxID=1561003 RepID=UPI000B803C95|nr:hypothetical protein [Candidatus Ichthyocystis hellenicum]
MINECYSDFITKLTDIITRKVTTICGSSIHTSIVVLSKHVNSKINGIIIIAVIGDINKKSLFILNVIRDYVKSLKKCEEKGKRSYATFGQCKFKVSEEVITKVKKVRSSSLVLFKKEVTKRFRDLIKENIVEDNEWSKELFILAVEAAQGVVDNQYKELKKIVSEAQAIDDDGEKRKITRKEKFDFCKGIM